MTGSLHSHNKTLTDEELLFLDEKRKRFLEIESTSWEIDGETVEIVSYFIFWGSKITADGDCTYEIKRRLHLGRNSKAETLLCQLRSV